MPAGQPLGGAAELLESTSLHDASPKSAGKGASCVPFSVDSVSGVLGPDRPRRADRVPLLRRREDDDGASWLRAGRRLPRRLGVRGHKRDRATCRYRRFLRWLDRRGAVRAAEVWTRCHHWTVMAGIAAPRRIEVISGCASLALPGL